MTDLWNPNVKFTFDFRDPNPADLWLKVRKRLRKG